MMEEDISVWTVTKAGLCAMNVRTGSPMFINQFTTVIVYYCYCLLLLLFTIVNDQSR